MSDEPIRPRKTNGQQPKIRKQIFNQPNTIDLWNGIDNEENSKPWVGGRGRDLFTAHVAQKEAVKKHIEYSKHQILENMCSKVFLKSVENRFRLVSQVDLDLPN